MEERCNECKWHYWLNGWKCKFNRWEFDLWIGRCELYEE